MAIVDTLITRYSLDSKGYKAGAKQVVDATASTGDAISKAHLKFGKFSDLIKKGSANAVSGFKSLKLTTGGLKDAFSAVTGSIGTVISFITKLIAGITAAGAAYIGLAYSATQQYAKFESIKLTFAGISGSLETAAKMMAAIKAYSFKSIFDEEPLAKAALQLTQINLAAKEYLPVVEALVMKTGELSSENLFEAVSLIRRLKGGQIADALGPEGVGRFGIGKDELVGFGAIVDASGEFKMNVSEALQVLKNMANSPEATRIREILENSPETRISNALGKMAAAFRAFGGSVAGFVIPALESLGDVVSFLAESGFINQLSATFASIFGEDDSKRGFVKFLFTVATTFEVLIDYAKELGSGLVDSFKKLGDVIQGTLELLTAPIQLILKAIDTIKGTHLQDNFNKALRTMGFASMGGMLPMAAWNLYGGQNLLDSINNGTDSKMAGFDAWQKKNAAQGDAQFPDFTKPDDNSALSEIASNTALTADNTKAQADMQRYILGGGDLGRMGVTATELHGRRGGDIRIKIDSGHGTTLDDWTTALVNRAILELKRRGQI